VSDQTPSSPVPPQVVPDSTAAKPPAPFLSFSPGEALARVVELGGKPFHARVIQRELFENGVLSYAAMTGLSKELRARLEAELPLLSSSEKERVESNDGTVKLLIELADGRTVETVHMPSFKKGKGATLCVSTQVGCPVGCPFCASGLMGLDRNLEAHEILEQYLHGRTLGPIARSVIMGIGEPLLNYPALRTALERVNKDVGLGSRKVTVSTVGFPERLRRIAPEKPPFQLAISLHSPFDEERWELVPGMRGVTVEEILLAGDNWFEVTGREVTYEIVLLAGKNDTRSHAEALAKLLGQRRATVNLIPWNPILGSESDGKWCRPSTPEADRFAEYLQENGIVATVRWSRGLGSDAACGQLRVRTSE
jgi:23S rRNA (adenine2503-C2)-methyltransferase